jgi:hypothetical protein
LFGGAKMTRLLLALAFVALPGQVFAQFPSDNITLPTFVIPASGVTGGGVVTSSQLLAPDGTAAAPSYSFASDTDTGFWNTANEIRFSTGGVSRGSIYNSGTGTGLDLYGDGQIRFGNSQDVSLSRPKANFAAWAVGDVSGSLSGATAGAFWGASADGVATLTNYAATAGINADVSADGKLTWAGRSTAPTELGSTQSTDPTCTSNCGTSPTVVGTDSEFTLTMGSSGVPASGFVITFNGTWPSNPQCMGVMAKTGMAVGKFPMVIVTTTTTATVTTNGVAPSTTDIYNFICRAGR